MPKDLDVTLGWIQQPQNQLHRRGLPRSIRPQQTENFSPPHFEVHIVHRPRFGPPPEIFEDLCQAADGDNYFSIYIRPLSYFAWIVILSHGHRISHSLATLRKIAARSVLVSFFSATCIIAR